MAHQAFMNDPRRAPAPAGRSNGTGLIENVSSFGNDVASLAALQGQLAAADARESFRRAIPSIAGLVVAILLAIAGVGVVVAGLALWIAEEAQMKPAVALMLTGLGALVLVALLAAISVRFLKSSFSTFRRSSEEFERNLAWVKTTLSYSGR
ncbi:phage holin family protein [Paludisphaera soli]|uniref:phage holin family protein n=1 Tax=Paludisphaera soli TaxID=2712865 RepID=UPI0013ED51A8|nr:phage holin family protein [Paludisphaera soli]